MLYLPKMYLSFFTMKAGSVFQLHSPEEQTMFVIEGYCDKIIGNKICHVREGDVIRFSNGSPHQNVTLRN